jgi:hypothetical protein
MDTHQEQESYFGYHPQFPVNGPAPGIGHDAAAGTEDIVEDAVFDIFFGDSDPSAHATSNGNAHATYDHEFDELESLSMMLSDEPMTRIADRQYYQNQQFTNELTFSQHIAGYSQQAGSYGYGNDGTMERNDATDSVAGPIATDYPQEPSTVHTSLGDFEGNDSPVGVSRSAAAALLASTVVNEDWMPAYTPPPIPVPVPIPANTITSSHHHSLRSLQEGRDVAVDPQPRQQPPLQVHFNSIAAGTSSDVCARTAAVSVSSAPVEATHGKSRSSPLHKYEVVVKKSGNKSVNIKTSAAAAGEVKTSVGLPLIVPIQDLIAKSSDMVRKKWTGMVGSFSAADMTAQLYQQLKDYIASRAVVQEVGGIVSETFSFTSDRLHYLSDKYVRSPLTTDDPEMRHLLWIGNSVANWETLPLRCRLSSLTWSQLQLVDDSAAQAKIWNLMPRRQRLENSRNNEATNIRDSYINVSKPKQSQRANKPRAKPMSIKQALGIVRKYEPSNLTTDGGQAR